MSWQVPDAWRPRVDAVARPAFGALPPRLAALALAVPRGARVVDIGTDHGLLCAALVDGARSGGAHAAHVCAVDISREALAGARQNLALAVAAGCAEVLLGDGFAVVSPGAYDCAVLAGMGARNTLAILARGFESGHTPERIVVQALAGEHSVRAELCAAGYALVDEQLTADGRRLFLTLVFERRAQPTVLVDDVALYVGPLLSMQRSPLLEAWLAIQAEWLSEKVAQLTARDDEHARTARRRLAAIHAAAQRAAPGPS